MGKEPEIFTFGCRLNAYESEIIEQNLIEKGWKISALKTGDPEYPLWVERVQ